MLEIKHKKMLELWESKVAEFFRSGMQPSDIVQVAFMGGLVRLHNQMYRAEYNFYCGKVWHLIPCYTVRDVHHAECNLDPLICVHCEEIGNVVYHQYIGDAYCQSCGKWQLEKENET